MITCHFFDTEGLDSGPREFAHLHLDGAGPHYASGLHARGSGGGRRRRWAQRDAAARRASDPADANMPHIQARECFCGCISPLSDRAIGGAVRRPALELHHSDERSVGRVRWDRLVKSRLALVMRILKGLRRWPLAHDDRVLCDDDTDRRDSARCNPS